MPELDSSRWTGWLTGTGVAGLFGKGERLALMGELVLETGRRGRGRFIGHRPNLYFTMALPVSRNESDRRALPLLTMAPRLPRAAGLTGIATDPSPLARANTQIATAAYHGIPDLSV